jgi:flagellum-specific peptidoglycan hydrolase FlgJ
MATYEINKQLTLKKNVPVIVKLLQQYNVNDAIIPFIISKMILETNWFSSNAYIFNNNPGGITWNANYLTRPGTSIGIKRPAAEGGNYVKFDTLDTAIKDYIRIISKKPGEPIKAITATDFAARLKQNGYYATSEKSYTDTLNSVYNQLQKTTDIASLIKKKNSLTIAALPAVLIGLIVGTLVFSKK